MGKLNSKKGIALVEIIAALFVFSVAFIGVNTFFSTGYNMMGGTTDLIVATNAAEEQIEVLRDTAYGSISIGTTTVDLSSKLREGEAEVVVGFFEDSNIKKVSVTVSWKDIRDNTLTKSFVAYITNEGIAA